MDVQRLSSSLLQAGHTVYDEHASETLVNNRRPGPCTTAWSILDKHESECPQSTETITETKHIIRDFLARVQYRAPHALDPTNLKLRAETAAVIFSWDAGLTPDFVKGLTDTSCSIAESAYSHIPYEHQLIVALYTAYMVHVDDLGNRDLDALGQFGRRFVAGEGLVDPVLERLRGFLQDVYVHYPPLSADTITVSTLDSVVGMFIEFTAKDMAVAPGAARYPAYLRQKTGIGPAYVLFNFIKGWRDPRDNFHLQLIPDIEHFTCAINDILSFYKELLEGETDNYIHLRAAAEQKDPLVILHELSEETLQSIYNVQALTSSDSQLNTIFRSYVMGYIEFHFRAERYRLEDLQM
ncbi:isoprenoid synthase domain-containing protein [Trametes meyenii]|nr:isoprenoid synthase domain-containing protein [Trametes meyenii]